MQEYLLLRENQIGLVTPLCRRRHEPAVFFFPSTGMLSADVFAQALTSFGIRALHFLMHRDGCECWAQEIGTVIDFAHHKRGKGACFASKNFQGQQRLTKLFFFLLSQEKATAKLTQS